MKILSWIVRGVGNEGFTQLVREFTTLYQPDILIFMETKVNSNKAEKLLNMFSFQYPFYLEISPIGYKGGLWILWKHSPHFQLQIIDKQSRFVHSHVRDGYKNNKKWLITFMYGYLQHHLKK